MSTTIDQNDELDAIRKTCEQRMIGCVAIVRRLRATGDPDDLADAAFLLGTLDDIAAYVGQLRGIA